MIYQKGKKMENKKVMKKKTIGLILVIIIVAIGALRVGKELPTIGDLNTPANTNISRYYISNAENDTHAQNIVTAVLADYRGFDTLFETCVLFLSGIAAMVILSDKKKIPEKSREELLAYHKDSNFGSKLMDGAFRIVVPIILIYAVYVLFHGEVSLGGGFQAGALIACAYLLNRIIPNFENAFRKVKVEISLIAAGIGAFFFVLTGFIPMLYGGRFMEFDHLPFHADTLSDLHADGILMVEIGVTVCVAGVIITILEVVLERTDFDD